MITHRLHSASHAFSNNLTQGLNKMQISYHDVEPQLSAGHTLPVPMTGELTTDGTVQERDEMQSGGDLCSMYR